MSYLEVKRAADRVRAVPLEAVLEALDAERDLDDRAKWHTGRGVLSVNGAKFMNWKLGAGGGGAIDLVIHLEGLDFRAAVAWLCRRFPDAPPPVTEKAVATPADLQVILPRRDPGKLALVLRYLVYERRLPRSLLEPFVERGVVYADERANAVFLMLAEDGRVAGAELRGTGPRPFRCLAKGSRKDLGCFSVPVPGARTAVICESAIDALSCHTLHPGSLCLSTAGARPDPLWLAPLLRRSLTVSCGFDADPTGDTMAQAMIALHPSVTRLRPPQKDWNDLRRSSS